MAEQYGIVTQQTIEEVTVIAGRGNVIVDMSQMEEYSLDETPLV